jgi:putative ATPase
MTTIEAAQADITSLQVDAIVNAANEHLQHGGGVAAAISRAAGPSLQNESDEWVRANGPLEPGVAAITTAGEMPARVVVHVAGPRYGENEDDEGLLRVAVGTALEAAAGQGARTVALPAISAGIFGYPLKDACRIIADTAIRWADAHPEELDRIILVGYDERAAGEFRLALQ